jgi:hypothetical protein
MPADFASCAWCSSARLLTLTHRARLPIHRRNGPKIHEFSFFFDRSEDGLAQQLHALGIDRTRLAEALDSETAHTKQLTATNREIAQRLDTAIATIQSVLDEQ